MRTRKQDVADKPNKMHHHSLKGHIANVHGQAPAGDIDPNSHVIGKHRGSGEHCRFHATMTGPDRGRPGGWRKGFDESLATLGNDMQAARDFIATKGENGHPLSADQKREEARRLLQDMMSKHTAHASEETPGKIVAGWEGLKNGRALTPSRSAVSQLRYHTSPRIREAPSPQQSSYHVRQGCRFHERRASSAEAGSFRTVFTTNGSGHAGRESNSRLRHDTPGGQDASLGRVRSMTPDYHRRYRENILGSSLPGAPTPSEPHQTPRTPRRVGACDPRISELTATASSKHAARYHEEIATVSKKRSQDATFALTSPRACVDDTVSVASLGRATQDASPKIASIFGIPQDGLTRANVPASVPSLSNVPGSVPSLLGVPCNNGGYAADRPEPLLHINRATDKSNGVTRWYTEGAALKGEDRKALFA